MKDNFNKVSDSFDFESIGETLLSPFEFKVCFERAAELERFLNHRFGLEGSYEMQVYVRLVAKLVLNDDDYIKAKETDDSPQDNHNYDHYYDYHFRVGIEGIDWLFHAPCPVGLLCR